MNTSVPPHAPGDTTGTPPPPPADGLERFFNHLRGLGLHRSDSERWIGGVCGGLAERLRVDPLIVRAAFVLLGLVFGAGITIYLVAWVLLPDRSGAILLQRALRGGDGMAIFLVIVAACVLVSGFGLFWGWGGPGPIVPLLLVGGLLFYLHQRQRNTTGQAPPPYGWAGHTSHAPTDHGTGAHGFTHTTTEQTYPGGTAQPPATYGTAESGARSRAVVPFAGNEPVSSESTQARPTTYTATSVGASTAPGTGTSEPPGAVPPAPGAPQWGTPPPPQPPRPRRRRLGAAATLVVLGLAAIVGSVTYLVLNATDASDVPVRLGFGAAAATVGIALIVTGFLGRKAGFASFIGLTLAVVTAIGAMIPRDLDLDGPHGERTWAPTTVTNTSRYSMGAGDATLDLTRLEAPTRVTTVTAKASVGELRIVVPDGLDVRVNAHVDGGEITTDYPFDSPASESRVGGMDRSRTFTYGTGTPKLIVDAELGYGEITIERTSS